MISGRTPNVSTEVASKYPARNCRNSVRNSKHDKSMHSEHTFSDNIFNNKGEVFLNFVVFNNKAVSIVNCVRPYVGPKARRSNCRAVGK